MVVGVEERDDRSLSDAVSASINHSAHTYKLPDLKNGHHRR